MSEPLPEIMTVKEAAAYLRLGLNNLYLLIQKGQVPFVRKLGTRYIIPRSALVEWLMGAPRNEDGSLKLPPASKSPDFVNGFKPARPGSRTR